MSGTTELERAYRRLVTCYPRSFRRENEEEIVAVLLATAREGQRRPSIAETADLLKGAVRMRMGMSRTPRTVLHAVRLMYLGALAEIGVLVTVVLTEGSIRAAVLRRNPEVTTAQMHPLSGVFIVDIVGCSIVTVIWLLLAWANGKGYGVARIVAIALFAISTAGMIVDAANDTALYAPAALIAAGVTWLIGLAAIVLLLRKESGLYFARHGGALVPSSGD
jgi:hypothetical protein